MDYQKIIIEADGEEAELNCYLWSESPEYAKGRKRPCILILPGGGYSFVSDREGEPVAFQFLAEGCQAAVLRYSVLPARYPTALIQAAKAMVLLREHAEEWNIDPDKIIVQGFSRRTFSGEPGDFLEQAVSGYAIGRGGEKDQAGWHDSLLSGNFFRRILSRRQLCKSAGEFLRRAGGRDVTGKTGA